jgi:hypothetical protein
MWRRLKHWGPEESKWPSTRLTGVCHTLTIAGQILPTALPKILYAITVLQKQMMHSSYELCMVDICNLVFSPGKKLAECVHIRSPLVVELYLWS